MKTTVRPLDTSVQDTVSARNRRPPADFVPNEVRHGTNVEQAIAVSSSEDYARQGHHLPQPKAEYTCELEVGPNIHEASQPEHRIAEMRGKIGCIDRPDARTAQDIDLRRAAEDASQVVEDVRENADLVRRAGTPPGKNHRDAAGACAAFFHGCGHATGRPWLRSLPPGWDSS
jgi:hypothetical protein